MAAGGQVSYPFAQSEEEMRRLAVQAEVLHTEPTRFLFHQAGLAPGMRILDVGCGAGDVSLLAAEFAGPAGGVVGIDTSQAAIQTAQLRAERAGLRNVSFTQADLQTFAGTDEFDALVGRSVLMYLPDPSAALRGLLPRVRTGGIVAFREVLIGEPFLEAVPRSELVDQFNAWYLARQAPAQEAMGINGQVGLHLHEVFHDAGLPAPRMWMHSPMGSEPDWPGWEYLGQQVQMVASLGQRVGVAPPAGIDTATFADKVRAHVLQWHGVLRLQRGVHAWARKTATAD